MNLLRANASSAPSFRSNVAANYFGKLWSFVSVYAFVPLYIHFLGISAYGLIAFHAVALAILFIADAGLSATFTREAARETDPNKLRTLLTSVERILLCILGVAVLAMFLSAEWILTVWLRPTGALDPKVALQCLQMMPFALAPQVLMSLYFGGLMGLQKQVSANAWTTLSSMARSGLVVLPIAFWPDPRVFFAWQVLVCGMSAWLLRSALLRALRGGAGTASFSWSALKDIRAYAAGMLAMSVISGLNTQLDRLVVSKLRPLEEFSYYFLAGTLAQIPYLLTMPIALALLPRLTALKARAEERPLTRLYELNSYGIATLASTAGFALFFFAPEAIDLWLPQRDVPAIIPRVMQLLTIGGILLALQLAPFQLSLANGHNRTNVLLGLVVLLVSAPAQIALTMQHGLLGAALPWLGLNAIAFIYLGVALNRRFYADRLGRWFLLYAAVPVVVSFVVLAMARGAATSMNLAPLASCAVATAGCVLALVASAGIWRVMSTQRNDMGHV